MQKVIISFLAFVGVLFMAIYSSPNPPDWFELVTVPATIILLLIFCGYLFEYWVIAKFQIKNIIQKGEGNGQNRNG